MIISKIVIRIYYNNKLYHNNLNNSMKIRKIKIFILKNFCQNNFLVNLPNRIPQLNIICIIYIIKLFIRLNFESMQDKTLINCNILKKFCLL